MLALLLAVQSAIPDQTNALVTSAHNAAVSFCRLLTLRMYSVQALFCCADGLACLP